MPPWCPHRRPPCALSVSRWNCARRTQIEQAIACGQINRLDGEKFAASFGLVLTPVSPVYSGETAKATQRRLI